MIKSVYGQASYHDKCSSTPMIRSNIIMCLSHLMDKFKTFHSSSGRSLSIISILCPCWHLQIIIFFLRKIKKPKMTSFVKLAAITYLWLVWNKNGLVIVFIRKLIFCYMMIHLTVRINCTFLYSFMLRYICLYVTERLTSPTNQ